MRPLGPYCRYCGGKLSAVNWALGNLRQDNRMCRDCASLRAAKWNKSHPALHLKHVNDYTIKHHARVRAQQQRADTTTRYASLREIRWKHVRILQADGTPLTWTVFRAVVEFQGGRCAVSGADESWVSLVADHDHKTGMFRGALSREVNHHALSSFERTGRYLDAYHEDVLHKYLADPPYQRWLRANSPIPMEQP